MALIMCKLGESLLSKLAEKLVDFALSEKDGEILKYLQINMKSLGAKASDVEEAIMGAELSGKRKRKREVEHWLKQVKTFGNELGTLESEMQTEGFLSKFFGGDRAAKLEKRVSELVEQSRHFGELVLDVHDIKGVVFLTKGMIGDEFKENLENIVRFFLVDKVSSIGIYGMGGVGKTTLAKHVNNRLLKDDQGCVVWITVSQEFTITNLQDQIAQCLGIDLSNERDEDKRASRLNASFSERENPVFIFDDLWEGIDLNKLGDPLSVDGCKLLITTRSKRVCRQINCEKVIEVMTLKENEAWDLFKLTLGQQMNLTPEVQKIAESMVDVCDGLPLGIITIAGSMKGETEFHVWSDARAELEESVMGNEDMGERVFKVLKYSFDRLDRREEKNDGYSKKFQHCFLYCSLYPEDDEIDKNELIRKFILEEVLGKRKSRKELFSQGHAILDGLVNICLLERVGADQVKMHDLVRAMALKITEGKTKVIAGQSFLKEIPIKEEWGKDLEKMSLMHNGISKIPAKVSPNCPKLLTLLLDFNPLKFIGHAFFLHMHSLFILDLSGTEIKKLPNSLSNMVSLRALLLAKCRKLEYVPCLGKLKELKELDLTGTAIRQMPEGMDELFNLKFLSLRNCKKLAMLPNDFLSKHQSLQCLFLPYRICASVEEMEVLKCLEEFEGRVQDAWDYNRLISSRPSLVSTLSIAYPGSGFGEPDEILRFSYDCHSDRNRLRLVGYDFNSRENKDVTLLDECTKHLQLDTCKGLPRLNNPNSIERLEICSCEEIEWVMRIKQFPDRGAFFSSLSVLSVILCQKVKKLGLPTSQLQNLKQLTIDSCEMIEEIMGEGGGLPKLEGLSLRSLPRLKSICSVTMVCSSIKYVELGECQALEKLPLVFEQPNYDSPPLALKRIVLSKSEKEWWEKLELGHTSHHSLLQPFILWA